MLGKIPARGISYTILESAMDDMLTVTTNNK